VTRALLMLPDSSELAMPTKRNEDAKHHRPWATFAVEHRLHVGQQGPVARPVDRFRDQCQRVGFGRLDLELQVLFGRVERLVENRGPFGVR
jgi:hypothetical protein